MHCLSLDSCSHCLLQDFFKQNLGSNLFGKLTVQLTWNILHSLKVLGLCGQLSFSFTDVKMGWKGLFSMSLMETGPPGKQSLACYSKFLVL